MSVKRASGPRVPGIEPSVGSKGDSYDNTLAETINGKRAMNPVLDRGALV